MDTRIPLTNDLVAGLPRTSAKCLSTVSARHSNQRRVERRAGDRRNVDKITKAARFPHMENEFIHISADKTVRDKLRESERKLREVSEQVLEAQEIERKRVASDLHDGIGQTLSSIKYGLESAYKDLDGTLPTKALVKLRWAVSSIQGALEEVRRISMDLRPSMLDDLGIEATINWLCREFILTNPSIEITKEINIRPEIVRNALSVAIFRILQEAFNNIAKHAHATRVHLYLTARKGEVTLSVQDNGRGFALYNVGMATNGFGLYSIKERARLSGGSATIHAIIGAGTRVHASWLILPNTPSLT